MEPVRCKTCSIEIEKPTFVAGHGPVCQVMQQEYCVSCGFLEGFRMSTVARRPFRLPIPRPTKEGKAPMMHMLRFEEWKATCSERVEGPGSP